MLLRQLETELRGLGLADVTLTPNGYVLASVPANSPKAGVPTVAFLAHVDTAPGCAANPTPLVHRYYEGGRIVLPDDPRQVLDPETDPHLRGKAGETLITTSGTTLLGADDKAGLAEIVTAAEILIKDTSIRHGTIKLLFTPDEEIGRGVDKVDLVRLGAKFAYTMDGETAGSVEDETFSADGLLLEITGVAIHPGFAKDRMENAIKVASAIVARLPREVSPEGTEGRDGFVHPVEISGSMDAAKIRFIVRDFTEKGLLEKHAMIEDIARDVLADYPGSSFRATRSEQYRNMKQVLDQHPEIVDNAVEAIRRAGLTPIRGSIRGGTDGSRLSFMGLPCPNIFAGGHAFHSPLEWVSRQDMESAVRTIVELARIWEERA